MTKAVDLERKGKRRALGFRQCRAPPIRQWHGSFKTTKGFLGLGHHQAQAQLFWLIDSRMERYPGRESCALVTLEGPVLWSCYVAIGFVDLTGLIDSRMERYSGRESCALVTLEGPVLWSCYVAIGFVDHTGLEGGLLQLLRASRVVLLREKCCLLLSKTCMKLQPLELVMVVEVTPVTELPNSRESPVDSTKFRISPTQPNPSGYSCWCMRSILIHHGCVPPALDAGPVPASCPHARQCVHAATEDLTKENHLKSMTWKI
eukprot:Gb_01618 [translate_table: standard]